jgi:hypothetical protein
MVFQYLQILRWRVCLSLRVVPGPGRDIFYHVGVAMKRGATFTMKTCRLTFALLFACAAIAGAAERFITFERNDFVWIAKLDGTA